MRVLALDYGAARTGVAVSDASGTLARPVCVVRKAATESGLAEVARRQGWEVLRFEKLGERLRVAAAVAAAAAVGGSGSWLAARRRVRSAPRLRRVGRR